MGSWVNMKLATANPFQGLEEFVLENEPLAKRTWYKIGGPARWFLRPRSVEDLQEAARRCVENHIPIYVLGLGANLLVKDEGVNGAVFHLDAEQRVQAVEAVNAPAEFMAGRQLIGSRKPVARAKLLDMSVSMKDVAA